MASTFVLEQLPIDVVGNVGSQVSLATVLTAALGTRSSGYAWYQLAYYSPSELAANDFTYWNLSNEVASSFSVNGSQIAGSTTGYFNQWTDVTSAQLSSSTINVGNDIEPSLFVTVPVSIGDAAPVYVQYEINVVAPNLQSPTALSGSPNPSDIVASAERYATAYSGVLNDNDCGFIAGDLAAAAGATMDDAISEFLNPAQNASAGFWRVVYRGSDPNPVNDWQTLVQPGDIVRMGWLSGGQHTTTILSVNPDGSITVFDNADSNSQGQEDIGIHTVNYDLSTIPTTVTIFRLSSDHLYLINGVQGETLIGSPFNNEFIAVSGDVVNCGPGQDEVNLGTGTITVNGGGGKDTAVFSTAYASSTITDSTGKTLIDTHGYIVDASSGSITVSNGTNVDILDGVSSLQFPDQTLAVVTSLPLLSELSPAQQLELIYIGYFDRAADSGGFSFWNGQNTTAQTTGGQSAAVALTNIANSFTPQAETTAIYPFLSNSNPNFSSPAVQAGLNTFIENVYGNLFGHTADSGGLTYWTAQIASGAVGLGAAVLAIANGASGSDSIILQNKITVASDFTTLTTTANLTANAAYLAEAKAVLANVDGMSLNDATVTAAEALIAPWIASQPHTAVAVTGAITGHAELV